MANITVLDLDFESITVNLPFSQGRKTITSADTDTESDTDADTEETDGEEPVITDDTGAPKGAIVGVLAVLVVVLALVALIKRRRGGDE